ncbi:hypothetical protein E3N88_26462 [Mikania micrantha]|uniref:alcohol dehydrogenase n=1 Tax=Mikania micrantha TaxID=192012 RepID=A0A5N6N9K1_9ASTR|nr:hypothetical protein E3N88_26462 [Mikania micrantha]
MSTTIGQVIRCKGKHLSIWFILLSVFVYNLIYHRCNQIELNGAAAVAWEAGKPLVIEEVEVAPPQKMEVRVKIHFTSLCHTDVYFWEAKVSLFEIDHCLSLEVPNLDLWVVESVGEGVTDLQPGDHVLPVFTGECKECDHCKSEESNMCDLLRINTDRGVMIHDQTSRFSINGKPIFHFVGTSTFSEYTVVHVGCLAKINPLAPLDKVCVLSCGISTGLGATVNVAKPKKGSSVAVFGLGAVGLAAAEGARIAGASRIIGVDLNANRFELAKQFGVTEFVNPKDYKKPVQEVIAEMTNGGVDRSVECTGHIDAMISAFECVHDGWGVAVLVGVPHKDAVFKTSPLNLLNERTLKGTFFGNYKPRSDIPSVVEQYMNKELELEKFITHEVPFSEINKAFDLMLKGNRPPSRQIGQLKPDCDSRSDLGTCELMTEPTGNHSMSFVGLDLIRRLSVKEPQHQLAYKSSATEIIQDPFFEGVNWLALVH